MIKGLLLYNEEDAQKNRWFINHLIETAKNNGIELIFALLNEELDVSSGKEAVQYDFCINRTRYTYVNEFFEENNIRCYNNLSTVKIANDKWQTYLLCKKLEIPVVKTMQINDFSDVNFEYPMVIKSRNGHGGREVFWINNKEELQEIKFENSNGYIAQKPVSNLGVDVRIYVLGDYFRIGVKRTSSDDFRSNFSLGGKVELFTPTIEQLEIIKKLQKAIASDYVGFDFMLHNGSWILNEIEDVVGARMLYSVSDCDIAEELVKYICKDYSQPYK